MSTNHEVICDMCEKRAPLKWGGEWIKPDQWTVFKIYREEGKSIGDKHLCKECVDETFLKDTVTNWEPHV